MKNQTINLLVNDAIRIWAEVTESNPDRKSFTVTLGSGRAWNDLRLTRFARDLNESRELDPTGLTTFMLLRGAAESYLQERSFSALDFLLHPAQVEATLGPLRQLRALLEESEVLAAVADFEFSLRQSALHYGLPESTRGELEKVLADKIELARLRRDALRSMETLEAHQFIHGPPDSAPLRVNSEIFEFWNMHSLLRATRAGESGVTLALVRDPEEALFSYFCIAVRNGASVTILTDRPKVPHPHYKRMARRADRSLVERAERHWFPYEFLGIRVTEDQKHLYAEQVSALVPEQAQGVRIADLKDLTPEEFVWWALLLEIIHERYGVTNLRLQAQSYTGSMVVNPEELVSRDSTLAVTGAYVPLGMPPVTATDLVPEKTRIAWDREPDGHNEWMVQLYGQDVSVEVLNPVGHLMLPAATEKARAESGTGLERAWMNGETLYRSAREHSYRNNREEHYDVLETLDPQSFNRPEDIQKDRVWCARMNQIKVVQGRALRDFDAKREAVEQWYHDAVERNREAVLEAAARGSWTLQGQNGNLHEALRRVVGDSPYRGSEYRSIYFPGAPEGTSSGLYDQPGVQRGRAGAVILHGGWRAEGVRYCYDRPQVRASVWVEITPTTAQALAVLAGVPSPAELPWPLAHWESDIRCSANHILNRLDPADWYLTNPWQALRFRVYVSLSKWAVNARRKALRLPALEWSLLEEKKEG